MNLREINVQLARQIAVAGIVDIQDLQKILMDCNRQGIHLGQTLVAQPKNCVPS